MTAAAEELFACEGKLLAAASAAANARDALGPDGVVVYDLVGHIERALEEIGRLLV